MSSNCNCCDDAPLCIEPIPRFHKTRIDGKVMERRMDKTFIECDGCWKDFPSDNLPPGSFQTYNAEWFCSEECGRKAGW